MYYAYIPHYCTFCVHLCGPGGVIFEGGVAPPSTMAMSGARPSSASDAEFRATFSLLPHVNSILTTLSQGDHTAVEKAVSLEASEAAR